MARSAKSTIASQRKSSPTQGFFGVDPRTFALVCELGLNVAVAYLFLTRGSDRHQRHSNWSVNAIEQHTGISRRRVQAAIERLLGTRIIRNVRTREFPRYELLPWTDIVSGPTATPDPEWVWLPNTLVDGAIGETPLLERLRQTREVLTLRLLVDLYGVHDLIEDGGLPRSLVGAVHERRKIGPQAQYIIWGFGCVGDPVVDEHDLIASYADKDADDEEAFLAPLWRLWLLLEDVGAIEWAPHLAEGDDPTAELAHPLGLGHSGNMDDRLGIMAHQAARTMLTARQCDKAEQQKLTLVPVPRHIAHVQLISVPRLRYRPHTKRTAAWYGEHQTKSEQHLDQYQRLLQGAESTGRCETANAKWRRQRKSAVG